jgi:hypothetical protein
MRHVAFEPPDVLPIASILVAKYTAEKKRDSNIYVDIVGGSE